MSRDDEEPRFERDFVAPAGSLLRVSPRVRRIVAPNPGPFTFTGTCTYVVGAGEVAVIDPGPENPAHAEALLAALAGEKITHIFVTHTHRDHSPAARLLQRATGAEILGCAPYFPARDLALGETNKLDAANDLEHNPGHVLVDGETFEGPGYTLRAVATPGHTTNHLCFELAEEKALFTGDHIMGWATSIVAPPDGAMRPCINSLEKLRSLVHRGLLAGPWRPCVPAAALSARPAPPPPAARTLDPLRPGGEQDLNIETMVEKVYEKLDPRLKGGAALTTLAHLEDLCARKLVTTDGPPQLTGVFAGRELRARLFNKTSAISRPQSPILGRAPRAKGRRSDPGAGPCRIPLRGPSDVPARPDQALALRRRRLCHPLVANRDSLELAGGHVRHRRRLRAASGPGLGRRC